MHIFSRSDASSAPSSASTRAGNQRPNFVLYEQLVSGCLEKIKNTVPRKCKELREMCSEGIEQVKMDADEEILNANKYFRIFKLALDTKIPRLTEQIIYHVQKLVAHGFMNGNQQDDCLYLDTELPKSNGPLPRKLIDAIIDEVCKCINEKTVQLQVVRALLTIVATQSTEVHERSLIKVMNSLCYIHIASTNPINQNTAKASLIQMISIILKKMEMSAQQTETFAEPLLKLSNQESANSSGTKKYDKVLKENEFQIEDRSKTDPDTFKTQGASSRREDIEEDEETLVTFSSPDQYAMTTLNYIVDNVCIHAAKIEEIEQQYQERLNNFPQNKDDIIAEMNEEIQKISLLSVPPSSKSKNKVEEKQKEVPAVQIVNELGIKAGKFGWCVNCRQSANLYCKHTRHPVCSFDCKVAHIRLLEDAQADDKYNSQGRESLVQDSTEPVVRDALLIFNRICQLLQSKESDKNLENVSDVRKVLLGLDLILSCLESPGSRFLGRREFVTIIKDQLSGSLLKFAVSSEHKIFSRTVSIFYRLFIHYREHLKQTIGVFIDNFFLRMLDSGNSEYDYKYSILEFFDRISENTEHILEIFANYDCDIGQKDIYVRVIDSLSSIAQGRFQRSEHQSVITPQQESSLRRQALEILVKILRNVNRTIEATTKLEEQVKEQLKEEKEQELEQNFDQPEIYGIRLEDTDSNSRGDQSLLTEQSQINENRRARFVNGESMAQQQMQNRVFKSEMSKAASKFNLKPKNGLKYLQEKGYLMPEPHHLYIKGICRFLKETPQLSATEIGKFIGEEKELNRECLSCYIDEFDFTSSDIGFVEALKITLQGFRIPGEGQIVDRIMEKFGEKLSRDRPEDFGNAEGVYLLAYATLMLQTSLHNPNAQKMKMTLNDFMKITSSVKLSNTKQIDFDKFRRDLFDQVLREPFTLEEDEESRMKLEAQNNTNKKLLFDKEREGILRRGANMLKQENKNNKFLLMKDISTIKPMFENTWSANLAVFSVVLDETEDQLVADLCLQGFIHAIKISGHFEINEVRNAFVSSLSKFTQVSATKELKEKNINCIRELLNLAIHDGDCLKDSWSYVLDCISKVDHMRALGLGDLTDSQLFHSEAMLGGQSSINQQQLLMKNSLIVAEQIDANQIEQIFLQSERLSPNAIIDFIENLCAVSKNELADEDSPKKFCLQKIVEVASLNMNRVRFQWQSIWRTLGDHFTWVGSHKNLNVVIYAIDSLRQLADKFLEKEEKKHFGFQKLFLKPFETIMLNNLHSSQKEIKEYIVMCTAALCHQKARHIKSGWEVILNIFTLAAQDTETHLVDQSFKSLDHALRNYFFLLEESFIELVNCLAKFSRNGSVQQSATALDLLIICANHLRQNPQMVEEFVRTQGQVLHAKSQENKQRLRPVYGIHRQASSQVVNGAKNTESIKVYDLNNAAQQVDIELSVKQELWFPILRIFTSLITDRNPTIRSKALQTLNKTLDDNKADFGEQIWLEIIGQVLVPVFEDIRLQVELAIKKNQTEQGQQYIQTFYLLLDSLRKFFVDNADQLETHLLTAYSDSLMLVASRINCKELVPVIVGQLQTYILEISSQLEPGKSSTQQFWSSLVQQFKLFFAASEPKFIKEAIYNLDIDKETESNQKNNNKKGQQDGKNQTEEQKRIKMEQGFAKLSSLVELIGLISQVIDQYFDLLTLDQINVIQNLLDEQHKFSKNFNSDINTRFCLWSQGITFGEQGLPGLLVIEESSLKVYLKILFKQFFKVNQQGNEFTQVQNKLFQLCSRVIKDYVSRHNEMMLINQNNKQKSQIKDKIVRSQNENEQDQQKMVAGLHEDELQKQLTHIGPIVHQVILENLIKLQDKDLSTYIPEVSPLLVDLTLSSDIEVRVKNHKLLNRIFEYMQKQIPSFKKQ